MFVIHAPGSPVRDKTFKVRRHKVESFIRQAIQNKLPGFEKIRISESNLNALPIDGVPTDLRAVPDATLANFDPQAPGIRNNEEEDFIEDENEEEKASESSHCNEALNAENAGDFLHAGIPQNVNQQPEKEELQNPLNRQPNQNLDSEELMWPRQHRDQPINEIKDMDLAAKCFPTLWANKKAMLGRIRNRKVSEQEMVAHLLKYAYQRVDGTWHHPFASHPRFSFWMLNKLQRHKAMADADLTLKKEPRMQELTVDEIQKYLQMKNRPYGLYAVYKDIKEALLVLAVIGIIMFKI